MSDSDFNGLVLDSDDYEGKINHIETPHGRTRNRNGALSEADQSILRSALRKLMRIARIGRPEAIYDASAAARTFTDGRTIGGNEESGEISEIEEENLTRERQTIFGLMRGFTKFLQGETNGC